MPKKGNQMQFTPEIQELLNMKTEYEAKVKDLGAKALGKFIQPFLEAHPKVHSIRWTQYTPHFNDGDACEFSVNDADLGLKAEAAKELGLTGMSDEGDGEDVDGEDVEYFGEYNFYKYEGNNYNKKIYPTPECKDLQEACNEISKALQKLEDLCKSAFGDHARVTITRTSVDVEEYDHD